MKKLYFDKVLLFYIFILLIYSIIVMYSVSLENLYFVKCKVLQIIFGIFVMIFLSQISIKMYEYLSFYLYVLSIFLLLLVFFLGSVNKGAQRWLEIGFLRFQPSEIVKISISLMMAKFIKYYGYTLVNIRNIFFF